MNKLNKYGNYIITKSTRKMIHMKINMRYTFSIIEEKFFIKNKYLFFLQ